MRDTPSAPALDSSADLPRRIREAIERALREGFIEHPHGLLPFLGLHEHQRIVMYSDFVDSVKDVAGMIVEVGIGRGDSFLTMARQELLLFPNDLSTSIVGFDTGAGFLEITDHDGGPDPSLDRVPGGYSSQRELVELAVELFGVQHPTRARRIKLIFGDAGETIPEFVAQYDRDGQDYSSLAIKLLHLDADLYQPTLTALEDFGPLLQPRALIILDQWTGAAARSRAKPAPSRTTSPANRSTSNEAPGANQADGSGSPRTSPSTCASADKSPRASHTPVEHLQGRISDR
jgi:hypothetical protein